MRDVIIINRFPDWHASDFNVEEWNKRFLNSNVILNSDVYEAVYPEHWGPLSLKFAFNGEEYYETENCRYRVTDGNFMLFNEDQYYSSSLVSSKAVRSFTINFCPEFKNKKFAQLLSGEEKLLDEPFDKSGTGINLFSGLYNYDMNVINEVFRLKEYIDNLNYNSLYINERLSDILEAIYKLNCRILKETDKVEARKPSTRVETYKRLTKAKDFIDSNFSKEISLDSLAKVSCMNPFHLLRKFKQFFGKTPHHYLTEVRLEEAKRILRRGNISITKACLCVGFEDVSSFSKLFKKYTGVTPLNYQKSI